MPQPVKPSADAPLFQYHASAYAFSGHFTRPFEQQIDVQASSSLCVTGGHGCSRVENFQFRNFISFKAGYTHVSGGFLAGDGSDNPDTNKDTNNTLVTSVLEGLNMMDLVTADRVVCRLYSKHPKGQPEGNITMHGSKFVNLQICGKPVTIDLDFALFEQIQTFKQAIDAYTDSSSDFYKRASDPFGTGKKLPQQKGDGVFLCSLAKSIQVDPGLGATVDRHSVYVPGFGTVYFAEVFMTHGQRVLTMFRYELGSSTSGGGSGGSGGTNGKQYPPGG
jgi:hypothetical protein